VIIRTVHVLIFLVIPVCKLLTLMGVVTNAVKYLRQQQQQQQPEPVCTLKSKLNFLRRANVSH
jgi:hypothetical protein